MSDASSFSLQQLSTVLQQIIQSPRQSPISQQAIDVLVKHFSAEQLLLISANGQQRLDNPLLKGELKSGEQYRLLISPNQQNLSFYAATKANPLQFPVTTSLAEQLLQLPPIQLKNAALNTLTIDALVNKLGTQNIQLTLTVPDSGKSRSTPIIRGKNNSLASATTTLSPTIPRSPVNSDTASSTTQALPRDAGPSKELHLSLTTTTTATNLKTGQPVHLELRPQGKNWQVVMTDPGGKIHRPIPLNPAVANELLTAISASKGLSLPANILPKLVPHLPVNIQSTLNEWLNSADKPVTRLDMRDVNKPNLQVQPQEKPSATMNLGKEAAKSLVDLFPAEPKRPVINNVPQALERNPSVLKNALPALHNLLRQLQHQQEQPSKLLTQLEQSLQDPVLQKSPEIKQLAEKLLQQVTQALPQGREQDNQQIRALLTSPAFSLSPVQMLTPPPTQGFVAGLVAMLQLSLASRLARTEPAQIEKLTDAINNLLGEKSGNSRSANVTGRSLRDFSQLEQQQQLSKTISRLLSNHQGNKVASAEQQIQGQENLFYNFSTGQGQNRKDVELLIRREPEPSEKKKNNKKEGQRWHLTMKLEVQNLGEVLTKAVLQKNQLELDFYTSNKDTLNQLLNFLPLLKKRFQALQIEVSRSQCQLGKIPKTLQQRPYQLFETKV